MRYTLMLVVAVVCGIVAMGLNYLYLTAKTAPVEYVRVKADVAVGEKLGQDSFEPVSVSGPLEINAVPFSDVSALYNRPAPRAFRKGELVLWQDVAPEAGGMQLQPGESGLHIAIESLRIESGLLRIGQQVGFVVPHGIEIDSAAASEPPRTTGERTEQIGPFRIVGIDDRLIDADPDAADSREERQVRTLTVATRLEADGRTLTTDANRLILANSQRRILGLTFVGKPQPKPAVAESANP